MMNWHDIFYLPKSDRKAIATLLVTGGVIVWCIGHCGTTSTQDMAFTEADTTTFFQPDTAKAKPSQYYAVPVRKAERFAFDPNTADSTQLLRLGLQPWQGRNIYKYRAKGGIYRTKEDFARLYGLTAGQYRELEPYIRIGSDYRPAAETIASPVESKPANSGKLSPGQTVSLAEADTTQLQQIPGIGPYFARRIVEYRQRLGGYADVSQLMEIEDFPEKALDYIQLETTEITPLNVNRLTQAQLRRHPYISYYQAKAITEYRRLYGPLKDISQLSLLKEFTDDDLRRLRPYLEY